MSPSTQTSPRSTNIRSVSSSSPTKLTDKRTEPIRMGGTTCPVAGTGPAAHVTSDAPRRISGRERRSLVSERCLVAARAVSRQCV